MNSYKELIVWQKSLDLVEEIYRLTRLYPSDERYGLVSQSRRAATGIPASIAEGYSRNHRKEYLYFVTVSFASGAELETHIIVAKRLGMAPIEEFRRSEQLLDEVMRMLNSLRRSLLPKTP